MIEDDAYRASSQYRYWSYTKESLSRIRHNTNDLASERVRAAFRRAQTAAKTTRNGAADANADVDADADHGQTRQSSSIGEDLVEIETLTVDEELKIVEWGCQKIMDMGEAMNPRIPTSIVVRRPCPFFPLFSSLLALVNGVAPSPRPSTLSMSSNVLQSHCNGI